MTDSWAAKPFTPVQFRAWPPTTSQSNPDPAFVSLAPVWRAPLPHGSGRALQARTQHGRDASGALPARAHDASRAAARPEPATLGPKDHGGAPGVRGGRPQGRGRLGTGSRRARAAVAVGGYDRARRLVHSGRP